MLPKKNCKDITDKDVKGIVKDLTKIVKDRYKKRQLLERIYLQGFTDGTLNERQQTAVNPHDLFENLVKTEKL